MKNSLTLIVLIFFCFQLQGQVLIYTEPAFPTADDDVTVYFDASEGNSALAGFNGDVYAHTGVITDSSTSPTDWKYVVSDWGVADPNVLMTSQGNDIYTLEYNIRDYYGIPMAEIVEALAFVFRDADGNTVGRETDGSDIYSPVFQPGLSLTTQLLAPTTDFIATLGEAIDIFGIASQSADLEIYDNGVLISSGTGTVLNYILNATAGGHLIEFIANNGSEQDTSSFSYIVPNTGNVLDPPTGLEHGINYTSPSSVTLLLYAPNKEYIFVKADFTDWSLDSDFQMNKSTDGNIHWIEITGLTPGQEYAFQYVVEGNIIVADPYSEIILDPGNDGSISNTTYPNLYPYPFGQAAGMLTLITPGKPAFDWQVNNFQPPAKTDMVVYEMMMRDFLETQNYQTLIDTLDYLQRLGINAIELMPVNEFEGNQSWGYNPSFHMALDKNYGTIDDFKTFIDAAHARGMAVILDVVYNHAFSQSPLCQLYWDTQNFKPSADNPWLNQDATHPFNVGYDFNHESLATKDWVDRVLRYWTNEFKIDGFRFDLSKGFTQVNNPNNVGAWGQYDASRIAILKRIADVVWAEDPDNFIILEHFAAWDEETELSDYGMMVWGNNNHNYNEGSMGWPNNDMSNVAYTKRGWSEPNIIAYMESHDEERMMYKNLEFGASFEGYDVTHFETALRRQELASTFFYTIPGPKMLWQFGELGYDYSINHCTNGTVDNNCRLDPKPIRWDYLDNPDRERLFNITAGLIDLKKNYEVFKTTDFDHTELGSNFFKAFHLNHSTMNATILGNFLVNELEGNPAFQNTGTWYEYFTGETLEVTDVNAPINLLPGEYRLYTTEPLPPPPGGHINYLVNTKDEIDYSLNFNITPNPSAGDISIYYQTNANELIQVTITDVSGKQIYKEVITSTPGIHSKSLEMDLEAGIYLVHLKLKDGINTQKLIIQK